MTPAPLIDSYEWAGGRESMLRFGPEDAPVVVLALPLFEEANRTRAFGVSILRALAEAGVGGVLPDLPGQGESEVATSSLRLADLRFAYAAAVDATGSFPAFGLAIRSGALIDTNAALSGRWHLSPLLGENVLREMIRTARVADPQREDLDPVDFTGDSLLEIAGNLLAPAELQAIGLSCPGAARIVRMEQESGDATRRVAGASLWRRAEPGNDLRLAQVLAADIAEWIATCDA